MLDNSHSTITMWTNWQMSTHEKLSNKTSIWQQVCRIYNPQLDSMLNPFVAVGWFINHYFFVKFFFLEEKIIPKIFQTFGWCIYPVSVTLWAPWLGDFDNLNLFYRKIKIEKMPKFETLLATRGLIWKIFAQRC